MFRRELRDTLHLAIPVVLTQVGSVAMGIVDTIMVGRLGPEPLSAVALGNALTFTILIVCLGTLSALDPLVAQAYGAGRFTECGRVMHHGAFLAVVLALPALLLIACARPMLRLLGQSPELVDAASHYAYAIAPGVLPFLLFTVLRQFMQGLSRARPALFVMIFANLLNVFGNWVLVYGNLGAPALGATGSAWSTTIARSAMFLLLAGWVFSRRHLRPYLTHLPPWPPDRKLLLRLARLGLPAGGQFGLEVGVFACTAMFMGWFGTLQLAGHQIAINLCSTTFMVPLGCSATAAVRVGQALGRHDVAGARRAALAAGTLGVGFMAVAALCFALFPEFFVRIYTDDAELVGMGVSLLLVGAAFQLSDGTQVIAIGSLRGAADTRFPMLVSAVAYWLVALPLGWALAFPLGWGPRGLWWGLTLGLTLVGVTLALRFHHRVREHRLQAMQALDA
ncbi:MAG TPA: MATE family efflux transporter [Candidatus Krumholzibacteria bacterium]|nr:MATE family efflux transporter [Candidatus Krumholzibacteria bacterium]